MQDLSAVAILARPWGSRGELIADAWTDKPERVLGLGRVYLLGTAGRSAAEPLELEYVRPYRGRFIMKFRGVDSVGQAKELAGAQVCTPKQERPPLPAGEYYQADLVGCRVIENGSGRVIGQVTGWIETGGVPLLEVTGSTGRQPLLIPFARSICLEVQLDKRQIIVNLPEGLEELNSE